MGANVIVIAGNPNELSSESFGEQLHADAWGRFAAQRLDGCLLWAAFDWEEGSFLSWLTGPRWRYLGLDHEGETPGSRFAPDPANSIQITFLKAMAAVERITGGAIHFGIDAVSFRLPEDAAAAGERFRLPPLLEDWIDDWRSAARIEPSEPGLVF